MSSLAVLRDEFDGFKSNKLSINFRKDRNEI